MKGDLDGGLAACRRAIELAPTYASAHQNLGVLLVEKGDLDGAIAAWRRAIELAPKNATPFSNLGVALLRKGDRDGALAAFRRAIELDPQLAEAHALLGITLAAKGDLDGGIAALRRATELAPRLVFAHRRLGLVLRKRFWPVLREVLHSGARPPADALERLGLAELCTYGKRYTEAVRFYRLAFQADGTLLAAHGYAAACAAVRAGKESHPQALVWLRGCLDRLRGRDRITVVTALKRWKRDDALGNVASGTDDLPDEWRKFWADVDALLKQGASK